MTNYADELFQQKRINHIALLATHFMSALYRACSASSKEHAMSALPSAGVKPPDENGTFDPTPPNMFFHLLFAAAMVSTIYLLLDNIGYAPYKIRTLPWNTHEAIGKTANIVLFTALAIALPKLQIKAERWHKAGGKLPFTLESKILLDHRSLPRSIIFLVLCSYFFVILEEHEPAIYAMALIAIFVAAEHLGGLDEQRQLLADYEHSLESLANASGLQHGKKVIYQAYGDSKEEEVRALVRFFDLDREWFDAKGNFKVFLEGEELGAFYNALKDGKGALFVADLPLPVHKTLHGGPTDTDLANQFNNLLGLAWQWCIMHEIAARRQEKSTFRFEIRIASTSNWIHLVGGHVYQLIAGYVVRESKVRDLALDIRSQKALYASLLEWARREIESAGRRGCSGEQYLCTIIADLLQDRLLQAAWLTKSLLRDGLEKLGMREWVARKEDYVDGWSIDDPQTVERCVDLFEDFLRIVTGDKEVVTFSDRLEMIAWQDFGKEKDPICPLLYLQREVM